ncbi:DUF396-domain-containing protein [Fomitiporia mediterranea MF3/22]|uniref:DUF396-domain-containing protein n=1 Tax=Fomitiporia mediterranea (strain MF3/22) TaxID=694068 RepID=UPI00044091AE|nr:DUF396-domain-containing protein [Fomitiporia mediterranea MF3/22]EJD01564.1 DUF396-domain-containing protein [Fomitiporia mediterranea MF3/22]
MSLLHLLSYVGFAAAAVFVVLSLASGLLWISEIIEEHSRTAKVVGIRAVYTIIVLHVILYFTDSLPLLHTLFSIGCHVVYLQNFSHTWPYISLSSIAFLASCALAIVNHFMWFFYFSRVSREARMVKMQRGGFRPGGLGKGNVEAPGFPDIATFFALCVWLVPLFLFLSLSANDNALPVSGDGVNSPTTYTPSQGLSTSRSSLFKSILDLFPFLRRRRERQEGILVTHTPTPSAPSTPRTSYSAQSPYSIPSRTPSMDVAMFPPSPTLRPPPPRRANTGSSVASLGSSGKMVEGSAAEVLSPSVGKRSSAVLVSASRSVSDETPVRRRAVAE